MKDRVLVHIDSVESGLACGCVCPVCSAPLQARKGQKNIHHFSHNGDTNCTPETVLHWIGKQFLFNRIKQNIDSKVELNFEWECKQCYDIHKGNLTKKAASVRLEYSLGTIIPDITIFDSLGKPRIAIEVVVSHPPKRKTVDYCINNKIYLFQFNLKNEKDLDDIEHEILRLDDCLNYCPEQKRCPKCKHPYFKRYIHIASIKCWKCNKPMKLAAFRSGDEWNGARDFSEKDCAVARELGAILNQVYSATIEDTYLACCCSHCRAFSGDFFLHEYFYVLEDQEDNKVFTGYYCQGCKCHFE